MTRFITEPIGVIHYDPYMGGRGSCGDRLLDSCGSIYRDNVTCEECKKHFVKKFDLDIPESDYQFGGQGG